MFLLQKTRFRRLVTTNENFLDPETLKTVSSLQRRLISFDQDHQEFRKTHDEICIGIPEEEHENIFYFEERIFEQFMEYYYKAYSGVETELFKLQAINQSYPSSYLSQSNEKSNISNSIKLPILQPPSFSGEYLNWTSFYDQFHALIDSNKSAQFKSSNIYWQQCWDIIKHLGSYQSLKPVMKLQCNFWKRNMKTI